MMNTPFISEVKSGAIPVPLKLAVEHLIERTQKRHKAIKSFDFHYKSKLLFQNYEIKKQKVNSF